MSTTCEPKGRTSPSDIVQRQLDDQFHELAAFESMKAGIVEAVDEVEDSILFDMSAWQFDFFRRRGFASREAVLVELRRHVKARRLREQFGDPAVLAQAQDDLAAARREEQTYTAEVADIGVAPDDESPVLANQIRALQAKLAELQAKRQAAEACVATILAGRQWLRDRAPKPLLENCKRELAAWKSTNPGWRRLCELRVRIDELQRLLAAWSGSTNPDDRFPGFLIEAEHFYPRAYEAGGGAPKVDLREFAKHVDDIRERILPALLEEQRREQSKWDAIVADVEKDLDRWVRSGDLH